MRRILLILIALLIPALLSAQGYYPGVNDSRARAMGHTEIMSALGSGSIFVNPGNLGLLTEKTVSGGGRSFFSSYDDEQEESEQQDESDDFKQFGLGYQYTWPIGGISGKLNINEKAAIEGILGFFFGDLKTYGGRFIYKFKQKTYTKKQSQWLKSHNIYGFGLVGAFSYKGLKYNSSTYSLEEYTETVFGYGAGIGLEYFFREFIPEIGWNIEIGFGSIKFEEVDYDFSAFLVGCGAHYYF